MNRFISFLFLCLLRVSVVLAASFHLNVEVTPQGSGTLNLNEGVYEAGSKVSLRTNGNTGFVFKGWYQGDDMLSSSTSFSFTMPSCDVIVQARYEYDPTVPADPSMPDTTTYYSLTTSVSPLGAGSQNVAMGKYAANAKVWLSTSGNTGYRFLHWQNEQGENVSGSASFEYRMPAHDTQLTAVYEYDPNVPANPDSMATCYTVNLECRPEGSGTFNIKSTSAAEGTTVNFYAYTNTGFQFLQWEDENGRILSDKQNFNYIIPHGDSKLFGVFEYNPSNPGNPNANYWDKQLGEVIVDDFEPGRLGTAVSAAISNSNRNDVAMITVAGRMNDNDFGIANDYTNCTLLDLSRVSGVSAIPSYAFDYTNLENLFLPSCIESIGTRAFAECKQLKSLTLYSMRPPTLAKDAFSGVPEGLVVYVPAASISQYQDAEGWSNFTFLPNQEDIRCVSISLPDGTKTADYAQMWLELTNTKNGQKMHFVMTDRMSYTFANIIRNTSWNAVLRNQRGDVFGKIDGIEVKDDDVSVAFQKLSPVQTLSISVLTPDGKDVTSQTQVTWMDSNGGYIEQSYKLSGLIAGTVLGYRISLPQELAMQYATPGIGSYTVSENEASVVCQLENYAQVDLAGSVRNLSTKSVLNGVVVTASQTFGDKYTKTVSTTTDANGNYQLSLSKVPTTISYAMDNHISMSVSCDLMLDNETAVSMPDVMMKSISGAVIQLGMTYSKCPEEVGKEGEVLTIYPDYNNVSYEIFNRTKQQKIEQFNVQYPQIVLLEEVDEGDELQLTAISRTSAFIPVSTTAVIDSEQRAKASFNIVELGKINASFVHNGNAAVVGSLYDSNGSLLKTYDYSNASLTVENLADGSYSLLTMGGSKLFNTIFDLEQLPQTGLSAGVDYVLNNVEVKSGQLAVVVIDNVPTLDESKLYYTGSGTLYSVNKTSIVAGNYLTLTAHLDFKPAYAASVGNVSLVVDLPASCSFVDNSVMIGNNTGDYSLVGNRLTIPMARYSDRVRFCVIPTLGGEYVSSATAQFEIGGKVISQPIGSVSYQARDLSINVPRKVAKTNMTISGTASGSSDVMIYDGNILIGQTKSLANGLWNAKCDLYNPYNLSTHNIYAKVVTKTGLNLISETKQCVYDKNAIEVSTVTMINTAHTAASLDLHDYVTVFDFQHPPLSMQPYWYWPSYPDFTFLVDFTRNDPDCISNVYVHVVTSDNKIVPLETKYDAAKGCWLTKAPFVSSSLPVNLTVTFDANTEPEFDERIVSDFNDKMKEGFETAKNDGEKGMIISKKITEEYLKENPDPQVLDELLHEMDSYLNLTPEQKEEDEQIAQKILDKWKNTHPTDDENVSTPELDEEFGDFVIKELEGYFPTPDADENPWIGYVYDLYNGEPILEPGTYHIAQTESFPEVTYVRNGGTVTDPVDLFNDNGRWNFSEDESDESTFVFRNAKSGDEMKVKSPMQVPWDNAFEELAKETFSTFDKVINFQSTLRDATMGATGLGLTKLAEGWQRNADAARKIMGNCKNPDRIIKLGQIFEKYSNKVAAVKYVNNTFTAISAITGVYTVGTNAVHFWDRRTRWQKIISAVWSHCNSDAAIRINDKALEYRKMYNRRSFAKTLGDISLTAVGIASAAATTLSFGATAAITGGCVLGSSSLSNWETEFSKADDDRMNAIRGLVNTTKSCRPIEDWELDALLFPPISPVMDPSGFVYEGVSSNRVEGVTATAYYKETVEDMYGDQHENIVVWDAAEYAQENPLFTDEYGMYAWDVPNGLWQVKFEKEGFETTYSEWLPVPPPQLDINIPMKQNVQPNVRSAHAYEKAVEIEFDKYMMPELLNTDNVMVMANGKYVDGSIRLMNEETVNEEDTVTFASKIRFNSAKAFDADEITLYVSNQVKSYAGIRMQEDFSQTFSIEHEVQSIVCDSSVVLDYGNTDVIYVSVVPSTAAAGRKLSIRSSSDLILSTDVSSILLGQDGRAEVKVHGELPGTAALTFSIDGSDLRSTAIVNVVQMVEEKKTVETPTASIASGTTVVKGTAVTLSCATNGATIYYTLDGTCPCDDFDKDLIYDGTPIVINGPVTIKVMATAPGMYESEVADFVYLVDSEESVSIIRAWDNDVSVYPIPVKDVMNVSANGKTIRDVCITNTSGVVVMSAETESSLVSLNVSQLVPGIYIVNVTTESGIYNIKITKE